MNPNPIPSVIENAMGMTTIARKAGIPSVMSCQGIPPTDCIM